MHFKKRLPGPLRVIRRLGKACCLFRIPELEIRHIDINNTIQQPQCIHTIVTAGVVNNGNQKPIVNGMRQGSQNLGHNVGRGHEIDIMAALFLEVYHHCSELLVSHFDPVPLVADPVILTEKTEKIAVRKKNCS